MCNFLMRDVKLLNSCAFHACIADKGLFKGDVGRAQAVVRYGHEEAIKTQLKPPYHGGQLAQ